MTSEPLVSQCRRNCSTHGISAINSLAGSRVVFYRNNWKRFRCSDSSNFSRKSKTIFRRTAKTNLLAMIANAGINAGLKHWDCVSLILYLD